ncbi:MAG: hypothetical protein R3B70_04485 [Polyangiaceae bacterium]
MQTVPVEGETGPAGATGSQGDPGVSPFSYVDDSAATDIYYEKGWVGIGTVAPQDLLHVSSIIPGYTPSMGHYHPPATMLVGSEDVEATANDYTGILFNVGQTQRATAFLGLVDLDGSEGLSQRLVIGTRTNTGAGDDLQERLGIDELGRVGIGTAAPEAPLHVFGLDSSPALVLERAGNSAGKWSFSPNGAGLLIREDNGTGGGGGPLRLIVRNGGNIGLGTELPQGRLDITNPDENGMPGNNYNVLLSHSSEGLAHNLYVDPTGKAGMLLSDHVKLGGAPNEDNYIVQHSVGIETTTPKATLDVNGTARLARYGAPPLSCDQAHDGTIALTSKHMTCVCDGTNWVRTSDGATACIWQ